MTEEQEKLMNDQIAEFKRDLANATTDDVEELKELIDEINQFDQDVKDVKNGVADEFVKEEILDIITDSGVDIDEFITVSYNANAELKKCIEARLVELSS